MFPESLLQQATALITNYRAASKKIVTAESCTGGLLAGLLTAIAGASEVVERGFITYSNEAKMQLLGVPETLIHQHGAVSEEVALAMALGALRHSAADVSIAVTGIAGPGGGSAEKPVGLVYIAYATATGAHCERHLFPGTREEVRLASVEAGVSAIATSTSPVPAIRL